MNAENVIPAPRGVYGLCMASVRELIIIYGDFHDFSGRVYDELWSYNTLSQIWRQYRPPIEAQNALIDPSICVVGNSVYIFGGSSLHDSIITTNSLISFDVSSAKWQILSPSTEYPHQTIPPTMYESLIFYHNEYLYLLGVFRSSLERDTMYKFSLKTSSWSLVTQNGKQPFLKHRIFGTVFKNQFYMFGCSSETNRFKTVYIFDFSTNTWTLRETSLKSQQYPDDRTEESFAFSRGFGYLNGGKVQETSKNFSDIWKIDLVSLEWVKLDHALKAGTSDHCTSVLNDSYLYRFGGKSQDSDCHNTLEKITIRPPTLFQLCLESIKRSPKLRTYANYLPPVILNDVNFDKNDSSLDS
ncbi:Kelch domain-containing protein 10 [Thelohanellus kitauei]|uniref:Kelch domain-containing protein 10 n=1 Tax=Thelohanellus kitauei TaxID=669202 RepID=A0A0C2MEB8_THEKT|nr:Kelch domain-containing protein 10 [Thelohanellus kitauei]